jgi:hypothetical protein
MSELKTLAHIDKRAGEAESLLDFSRLFLERRFLRQRSSWVAFQDTRGDAPGRLWHPGLIIETFCEG